MDRPITSMALILICLLGLLSHTKAQTIVTVTAPPSAEPTSPSYASSSAFESQMLGYTNIYRAKYNASALTWNKTLAQFAQQWSSQCTWEHSDGSYGENLAEGYLNVSASVGAWANESKYYNFDAPMYSDQTGHFTQLVWKATSQLGCGVTNCPVDSRSGSAAQGWFVVCEYEPPGNVVGDDNLWLKQNVDPPIGTAVVVVLNRGWMLMLAWFAVIYGRSF